jgi:hypothetical protein
VFTLGIGNTKRTASEASGTGTPLAHVRSRVGDSLARFDRSVKHALRKIPGSRMPAPKEEACAKPSGQPKTKAKLFSRQEKDTSNAKVTDKTKRQIPTTTEKLPKMVEEKKKSAPRQPPKPTPPLTPSGTNTKHPDDAAVRGFIRRSYKTPVELAELRSLSSGAVAPGVLVAPVEVILYGARNHHGNSIVTMPIKPGQLVTVDDLSEQDKTLLARARAAMAGIEMTQRSVAIGAAAGLLVTHLLVKALRSAGGGDDKDDQVELDIDSAFGTPTRPDRTGNEPTAEVITQGKENKSALPAPDGSVKNLFKNNALASSNRNRFGTGADAFAAVAMANVVVQKATRRLKKSGTLIVNILETKLDAKDENGEKKWKSVVAVGGGTGQTGATSLKPFDSSRKASLITFNARMRFQLPASSDGHASEILETRLCDADGKTFAKTAIKLKAAIRAAPVTKTFPIHDRRGNVVGTTRITIEWDVSTTNDSENDAHAAATALLGKGNE